MGDRWPRHGLESWSPESGLAPAVSSLLFMGRPGCPAWAHKGRLWAVPCGPASWHVPAARSPGRTMVRPLSFAGPASVNRALLTAGAALTPEEFQKWNNVRPAWAPEAAARSGPRKTVVWACLYSCPSGWHFNGSPGWVGWVGGREKGEGNKENPNYPVNEPKLLWLDGPAAGTPPFLGSSKLRQPGLCGRRPLSRLIQHTPSCLRRVEEGREGGSDSWRPQGSGGTVGTTGRDPAFLPGQPSAWVSVASQRACVSSGGGDGATPCHRPTEAPEGTLWPAEGPHRKSTSISPVSVCWHLGPGRSLWGLSRAP